LFPKIFVLIDVGVGFVALECFVVWAEVGVMLARAAAFVVPPAVAAVAIMVGMAASMGGFIGDRIGVRMHGGCIFGGVCIGVDCLLLKEVSEERDLVVDCVRKALGSWSIGEFADTIGTSQFGEDRGDAVVVMGVVVHEAAPDGLEGRAEFMTPVFTGSYINVGEEDEGELGRVDVDAVGMHVPGLGPQ
jgi:hypothetical protein